MAFAGLSTMAADSYRNPLSPKQPHFKPRAKRIIFACMRGGPSHVDTFDYKPALAKDNGKSASGYGNRKLLESPWKFPKRGKSGIEISELYPNLAKHADKMCLLNSMYGDIPNHPQCFVQLHTGSFQFVRPSLGSWVLYGLGTENQNLPGFVTLNPPSRVGGAQNYGSAFLPAIYQGTRIGNLGQSLKDVKIANLGNGRLTTEEQRRQLDYIQSLNQDLKRRNESSSQIDGVIESYELAFRMQAEVPGVIDLKGEPEHIRKAYGMDRKETAEFGRQCLMARRLVEKGINYVQVEHSNYDTHNENFEFHFEQLGEFDRPFATLVNDLAERGLMKSTLIVVLSEFGRTPKINPRYGRDHWGTAWSVALGGCGITAGATFGKTNKNGTAVTDDQVDAGHLFHTYLKALGMNSRRSFKIGGQKIPVADPAFEPIKEILA